MKEKNYDALKLENQLCFPLYVAAKEVVRKYTPVLNQLGITYTQYIALMVLWAEKSVSVKELGEKLYLDSNTLTPLLKTLEKKGLVTRERNKVDERVLTVSLTKEGEKLKERAVDVPSTMAKCMSLSEEEIKALYSSLYKIINGN